MMSSARRFPVTSTLALILLPALSSAQAPPVPAEFQDVCTSLSTYLANFNTTMRAGSGLVYKGLSAANLTNANSNAGPQLIGPGVSPGVQLQLQEIKAMGATAVMVQVCFPLFYRPFHDSQDVSYDAFLSFYQNVASSVRAAGLKLIIENDTLLTGDVQAGWNVAPFYATLDWEKYKQARAQTALTIAQALRPDFLVVVQEPNTEAGNSGQSLVSTPAGSADLLSAILTALHQADLPGMLFGAGTCTAQQNLLQYIQSYAALPVDFIDMHIYPINRSFLDNALLIANTAAAAGKPVAMSENWLWKIRDSEVNVLTPDKVRARNPFDFWAPLDASFLRTMENLAQYTGMLFMAPMGTQNFTAYLPYDDSTKNLPPAQILNQHGALASQNMHGAIYSATAASYHDMLVTPPDTVPPTVPTGVSAVSANPTTAFLTWSASADDIGVAGYHILRDGTAVATSADLYFQDTGLAGARTYTYTIDAFDLAGNVSAPSGRAVVTTADPAPTPPSGVSAVALSCTRVTVTWSPSSDPRGVNYYTVFSGSSPGAMVQTGRVSGSSTTFISYPLTEGTTYYYGVQAVDPSGNISTMSPLAMVKTPMPPAPPGQLTADAVSAARINLAWSAAASGGLPIKSYQLYRGSSASTLLKLATAVQTSYTDSSVSPGTTYYYAVQASDTGSDLSAMSAVVKAAAPPLPSMPASVTATAVSTTRVTVTWSASSGGSFPIQNYRVYRGSSPSTLAQVAVTVQTSYSDAAVAAGTTYYYAVAAANTASDLSPRSPAVKVTVPVALPAPVNLSVRSLSASALLLTWTVPPGGLPVQRFNIFRGASPSAMIQVAAIGEASYTDAGLPPSARYYYAVQSVASGGDLSPLSATVSGTTLSPPMTPYNLTATAVFRSEVNLVWAQPHGSLPVASYTIYRGSSASSLSSYSVAAATSSSFTDRSVSPNTTYYYAVQAKDTAGNVSPLSKVVAVTTPR